MLAIAVYGLGGLVAPFAIMMLVEGLTKRRRAPEQQPTHTLFWLLFQAAIIGSFLYWYQRCSTCEPSPYAPIVIAVALALYATYVVTKTIDGFRWLWRRIAGQIKRVSQSSGGIVEHRRKRAG